MTSPAAPPRRRSVVAGLAALAALAAPFIARGQGARRLAFVHSGIPAAELTEAAGPFWVRRFFAALRDFGYAEGRNLTVYRYSAEGHAERFTSIAAAVVATNPDVIVTNLNALANALKAATAAIPIAAIIGDPVRGGIVETLSRPGGNVTGVTTDAGIEIYGRQLQILREAVPSAARVACLASGATWDGAIGQVLRAAASRLGVALIPMNPPEIGAAQIRDRFAAMAEQRVDAAIVSSEGDFLAHRALIVELARSHRIPAMYPYRDYVDLGGLMAYAPDLGELAQRLADAVRQILAGMPAGDIPFYQPTTIQLLVNQGAARAIGLALPPALLAHADEVIE